MNLLEQLAQPGTATIVVGCLSIIATFHMTFFKWLGKKFDTIFDKLENQGKEYRTLLDIHEGRDQQRHEENLARFEQLHVSLARLEENVEANKDQSRKGSSTSPSGS